MNDNAASRSIAVLRTRLPYIDRRSLSQAWFSALHLADNGRPATLPARRHGDEFVNPRIVRPAFTAGAAGVRAVSTKTPRASVRAHATAAAETDGHLPKRPRDAAKAGSAIAYECARSYPPFATSLTIGVDGARIKLLLRRDGPKLHVVALCAERNVELVRRALACADAHLRRSGESICASVRTLPAVTA